MNTLPCSKRVFPLKLAPWILIRYEIYLSWLRHLLERLGYDCALAVWQEGSQDVPDALLRHILSTGWNEVAQQDSKDVEGEVAGALLKFFPAPVEGVSLEMARQLVERMQPISQIKQTFSSPNVWREITAYEALHLAWDCLASLTEALIRFHGKQGELIAYDLIRERRLEAGGANTGSVAEFIASFTAAPTEANIFTAGLETEIVHASELEVILHVKECEWARYFQERHPQVGYLIACSTDEVAYRAFNKNLCMQRTSTLMEGGKVCDFRIYGVQNEL